MKNPIWAVHSRSWLVSIKIWPKETMLLGLLGKQRPPHRPCCAKSLSTGRVVACYAGTKPCKNTDISGDPPCLDCSVSPIVLPASSSCARHVSHTGQKCELSPKWQAVQPEVAIAVMILVSVLLEPIGPLLATLLLKLIVGKSQRTSHIEFIYVSVFMCICML